MPASPPEDGRPPREKARARALLLGVALPLVLIAVVLTADVVEGPKTAYVGVLSAIPMLSAVFARPRAVAAVVAMTWLAAWAFGRAASDGNVTAQNVRLVIIVAFGAIAVWAATVRQRDEHRHAAVASLADEAERLHVAATHDVLTGLLNRRGLLDALAAPVGGPRSVALLDVDGLKQVNDTYGHAVGDEYLQAVSARVAAALATADVLGRWGGDEFVAVLHCDAEQAVRVMQRVHHHVTSDPLATAAGAIAVGVSIGVTGWRTDDDAAAALERVDRAMYRAKRTDGQAVQLI